MIWLSAPSTRAATSKLMGFARAEASSPSPPVATGALDSEKERLELVRGAAARGRAGRERRSTEAVRESMLVFARSRKFREIVENARDLP